jgi:hypothetical protein
MRTTPLDEMSPEKAAEAKRKFLEAFAQLCVEHGFEQHLSVRTEPVGGGTSGFAMVLSLNFVDAHGDGGASVIHDVRAGWDHKGFTVWAKLDRDGIETFSWDLIGGAR